MNGWCLIICTSFVELSVNTEWDQLYYQNFNTQYLNNELMEYVHGSNYVTLYGKIRAIFLYSSFLAQFSQKIFYSFNAGFLFCELGHLHHEKANFLHWAFSLNSQKMFSSAWTLEYWVISWFYRHWDWRSSVNN